MQRGAEGAVYWALEISQHWQLQPFSNSDCHTSTAWKKKPCSRIGEGDFAAVLLLWYGGLAWRSTSWWDSTDLVAPESTVSCSVAANGGGSKLGLKVASGRRTPHEGVVDDDKGGTSMEREQKNQPYLTMRHRRAGEGGDPAER